MTHHVHCPPKINLYLRVVGRREDGFHELETVFQSVSGGDELCGEEDTAFTLACDDPEIPTDERNLVVKAGLLLQERFPETAGRGARLELRKGTPVGAGMGGGSVNGAAALHLLARLWDCSPSEEVLAELAAALGSDVPFFLRGGTALARGRGEALAPLPTPSLWFVLVKPPVSVHTGWAYRRWNPAVSSGPTVEACIAAVRDGDPLRIATVLRNDLEPGVVTGVPEIAAARSWLEQQGVLRARMTGSGSVVFGICRDESHAREIAARPCDQGHVWAARSLNAVEAALVVTD